MRGCLEWWHSAGQAFLLPSFALVLRAASFALDLEVLLFYVVQVKVCRGTLRVFCLAKLCVESVWKNGGWVGI